MEKIIKGLYLTVLFGGLLILAIWRVKSNPDSKELEIKFALNKANKEMLPYQIGDIGRLDSMIYRNNKIICHASPNNGIGLSSQLIERYQQYKEILLLAMVGSDSENKSIKLLNNRYPNKVNSFCYIFHTSDGEEVVWDIPLQEFLTLKMTSADVVVKCSKTQFEVENLGFPITYNDIAQGSTITLLKTALFVFMNQDMSMVDIYSDGNKVVWVYDTNNSPNFDFEQYRTIYSKPNARESILKYVTNVPNVKEYLKFFSSTGSDLNIKYINTANNDTLDVVYPNWMIKRLFYNENDIFGRR